MDSTAREHLIPVAPFTRVRAIQEVVQPLSHLDSAVAVRVAEPVRVNLRLSELVPPQTRVAQEVLQIAKPAHAFSWIATSLAAEEPAVPARVEPGPHVVTVTAADGEGRRHAASCLIYITDH